MSDLTTDGVMLGLCGPDYAGGPYDYDLESRFKEWLSELIRKEREEAWDEGRHSTDSEYEHIFNGHPVPEGEMCGECEQWAQNPYRR